jgi:transcriptional regulator with XRE-family HTH domain
MRTIGEVIKLVRTSKLIGQIELANRLGVDKSFISHLETGRRDPSWEMINRVAVALDVNVTFLVMLTQADSPKVAPFITFAMVDILKPEAKTT